MTEGLEIALVERVRNALRRVPVDRCRDVYAVSLWVDDYEDDPSLPVVQVSVNTESHVARMASQASDEDEARWNFAFWLQEPLDEFGGPDDAEGKRLVDAAFSEAGLFSDPDDWSDGAGETKQKMTALFVSRCVSAVRRLHDDGVVAAIFGRPIPVLVHELEYYDEIVEQNRRANPAELIEPFASWVASH